MKNLDKKKVLNIMKILKEKNIIHYKNLINSGVLQIQKPLNQDKKLQKLLIILSQISNLKIINQLHIDF